MEQDGSRIRTLRQARTAGMLTVRALASAVGCSPHTVHEIEQGRRVPRFATIRRLSAVLGIEPAAIAEFRRVLLIDEPDVEREAAE